MSAKASYQSTGNELIQEAQSHWDQLRQDLPEQHRQELGQVMQELSNRISYVCKGEVPTKQSRYASLDGSALAQHAQRTVQQVAQQIPIHKRGNLTEIVSEMAQRVEHASNGVFTSSSQFGSSSGQTEGLSGELSREQQGRRQSRTPEFVA